MASQTVKIKGDTFVNLVPLLDVGTSYVVQPISGQIRMKEIAVPAKDRIDRGGHIIGLNESWYITPDTLPIWVWSIGVPAVVEISENV